MKKIHISVLFGLLALLAPWVSFGSDFQQRQSSMYPYRSTLELQEDFLCGTTTTGNIGCGGFAFAGGTLTILAGEVGRPGLIRRETGIGAGTVASLLTNSAQNMLVYDGSSSVVWVARLNTNDAAATVRYGMMNSHTANPPTSGIYIEKLDADTNWFCITRSGGVQTRTDSGVATTTAFTTHGITKNSSGVQFSIDNTNVCGVHTTNIPTGITSIAAQIVNGAAVNKTHDIDYMSVTIFGLTR